MKHNIAVLATLDTKGEEAAYVKELLEEQGHLATLIDIAPLGPTNIFPDVPNTEVAKLGGWDLENLVKNAERDEIMSVMGKGAAKLLTSFLTSQKINGALGFGGNQGSAIAAMALRALPFGFPKMLVSTVASGNIRPYIGYKDITVMFSVCDLLGGPNPVTRSILSNAVNALTGMVNKWQPISFNKSKKTIAISALGNTQPTVERVLNQFRQKGFEVIAFHASGAGGSAMEELITEGLIDFVLDLTPHELSEEIVGAGVYIPIRPGRLTAAGLKGIPQVVSTGGLEYLCFGTRESIPSRFRKRKIYMHNPINANLKTSKEEMADIGQAMAERLNLATAPVVVLIPTEGWSVYGSKGQPFYDPESNQAFISSLKKYLKSDIKIKEISAHINDPMFADQCVEVLLSLAQKGKE